MGVDSFKVKYLFSTIYNYENYKTPRNWLQGEWLSK